MKYEFIYPMSVYFLYIGLSTVHMFRVRKRAILTGAVHIKYYKSQTGDTPPENVVVVGRHYDNQFQVPMLFFITCLVHMQVGLSNSLTLVLAWLFVFSRFAHSWVLLGKNNILKRATAFGLGWLILLLMWLQLIYFASI